MSMSDPIADMLTRMRNALMVGQTNTSVPYSKLKLEIARVMLEEGYIEGFTVSEDTRNVTIDLKYYGKRRERRPVISNLVRISKPGRRVYAGKKDIPWVLSGMGIAILSTPKGVMTGAKARREGIGGEVIAYVW
jgi:small subunit ribosomal protein S8